jgi:hypothetical protein
MISMDLKVSTLRLQGVASSEVVTMAYNSYPYNYDNGLGYKRAASKASFDANGGIDRDTRNRVKREDDAKKAADQYNALVRTVGEKWANRIYGSVFLFLLLVPAIGVIGAIL